MLIHIIILSAVAISTCKGNASPTEEYLHQADLDAAGDVVLYWKFNETHITFEVD